MTLVAAHPHVDVDRAISSDHDPGSSVLACYLAVDTSDSMTGPALDAAGTELARLWDAVRADPRLAGCRLAVLTFDAEARVQLPLTRPRDLRRPPRPAATGPATNYEAVLTLLHRQIDRDAAGLRASGLRPLRPVVLFLTDGRSTRGYWPSAHAALTDPGRPDAPDVVAFGMGDVDEVTLRRIGTAGAHLLAPSPDRRAPARAGFLATATAVLIRALADAADRDGVAPVTTPSGWRSLPR